jgi:lactate dehydrogenase-like 2-hydroxyacid dehydrogenase
MPDQPTVLLAFNPAAALREALAARYALLGPMGKPFPDAVASLTAAEAATIRAVFTMGTIGMTREAMAMLPSLGLVVCLGSGYEGVDLAAARERNIIVAYSPGANASSVADLAMGLLLASVRKMFMANAFLMSGEWEQRGRRRFSARGLTGRRIGIYGLGAIGEKVARRAAAFEMEIGYHNRKLRPDIAYRYFDSLLGLATWADVLMIAVRAGAENRHAVDAQVLAALGDNGHVINISRGSVIDEAALIAALQNGTIAGAGLDVFEREPIVPQSLSTLPNVALTPHIGADTIEAQHALGEMVLANLEAFFADRPVPSPVPV